MGAKTFNITTRSITTLGSRTLSIMILKPIWVKSDIHFYSLCSYAYCHYGEYNVLHFTEYRNTECSIMSIVMLNAVTPSVVILNVIVLSVLCRVFTVLLVTMILR